MNSSLPTDFLIEVALDSWMKPENVSVQLSKDYNRRNLSEADEKSIVKIWESRLKDNSTLYNATKFRFHSIKLADGACCLNLGLTCYRDYLGTNWSPNVASMQSHGLSEWGHQQAFLADPLSVGGILLTSDKQLVFIRRSATCAEGVDQLDFPGGHAEPSEIVGKMAYNEIDMSDMRVEAVVHELFDSQVREIMDEVNIPRSDLDAPLFMGVTRNKTSGGRATAYFFINCKLTSVEVSSLYWRGDQPEAAESTGIQFRPLSDLQSMMKDPELTPSSRSCLALYCIKHHITYE